MAKVTIECHKDRLRLRWQHQGKRFTMACGVPDNPVGRSYASGLKAQIELDIQAGYFDPNLLKYRPRTMGPKATEIEAPELFRRFTTHEARAKGLAPGSLRRYQHLQSHLDKSLGIMAHVLGDRQAGDFAAYLLEHLSPNTVKSHLYLLAGCWDWARGQYHLAESNPWPTWVKRIKPAPRMRVKPFTRAEIIAILEAFEHHPRYRHYHPFVLFLVNTGCRLGEAAGLKWEHLGADFQTAWIGESVSRGNRKSTKTNKARTIVLNPSVQTMLKARHERLAPFPSALVFPSPKGGAIDDKLFRARAWKAILTQCRIEYRKPYALRHTAGSMAAAGGANPIAIAEQMGHDKRVFMATYAHEIEKTSVFQEF